LDLSEIVIRPVTSTEEKRYQELMQRHHYLGTLRKIGETLWYVATYQGKWVALSSFSTPAWKCAARDQWIGWEYRYQYDRLKLLTNNSRFLILPEFHVPNPGSRVLGLCRQRIASDWRVFFGHSLLLLETFVDQRFFTGTVYKASNWIHVGDTKGYHRVRNGYSNSRDSPKMVFVKPLFPDARDILASPTIQPCHLAGRPKMKLKAEQMNTLPKFFRDIPDPRRAEGRRHGLHVVLAIAAGAILCGMEGYKAIGNRAASLGSKARARFGCRRDKLGKYVVPSESTIRDILIRVDPGHLDQALQRWNEAYGTGDSGLAIDGKTMRNAIDDEGRQTHVLSAVGHESKMCHAQKKWVVCP
jgi:hypothetical protein